MRRRHLALIVSLAAAWAGCKDSAKQSVPATGSALSAPTTGAAVGAEDPWAPKTAAAPMIERPLFWAATKDGHTTYLLGTIHMGINADTQLPPWVKARLDGARAFAMEADIHDPRLLGLLSRTDGGSMRLDLGPAYWAKLEAAIGADLAKGIDKMKPFTVMVMLEAKNLPMTLPMDSGLETRAKDAKKPIIYFEEGARQLEIVEPFMTTAEVKAALDHLDYAKAQSAELLAAYLRGDEVATGKQFDDQTLWLAAGRDPAQFPAFIDALLGKRNASWIPAIEKLHAEGGGFVAVGAGHLVGPANVLELLRARGFTITRLTGAAGEP